MDGNLGSRFYKLYSQAVEIQPQVGGEIEALTYNQVNRINL